MWRFAVTILPFILGSNFPIFQLLPTFVIHYENNLLLNLQWISFWKLLRNFKVEKLRHRRQMSVSGIKSMNEAVFHFCFLGFRSIYFAQNHTKTKKMGNVSNCKNDYWVRKLDKYLNHPQGGRSGYDSKIKGNKPLGGAKFLSGLSWKCILTGHNTLWHLCVGFRPHLLWEIG